MQGDDGSMARIEAPKRRVEELALGERAGVVGHVEGVDRGQLDLDRAPTTTANEVQRQALTVSRCSQASKRAGSRSPGRSRQARMRLS